MARITRFLAWVRNRMDEFFREDQVSKNDSAAGVEQGPSQVARRPIWDAWSRPQPRAQRQAFRDAGSEKPAGPIPPSVVAQGALDAHAEFGGKGR